jgi:GntR family transcriptional regulator
LEDRPLNIVIRNTGDMPIYEQIVVQIKQAIVAGELTEGEALPSMRLLAKELRISLITTKRAYEELEREGFIVTMTGRGSFVAAKNLDILREEQRRRLEAHLADAVDAARAAGVDADELCALIRILYQDPF